MNSEKSNQKLSNTAPPEEHISPELMYEYLEGELSQGKRRQVEAHLATCQTCFQELSLFLRNALQPATAAEEAALAKISRITREEQITKILTAVSQECAVVNESGKFKVLKKLFAHIKLDWLKFERRGWRPAVAITSLVVLIVALAFSVHYYRTDYKIRQAENILQTNHRVYIEDVRLAGDYKPTGISMLMDEADEKLVYLDQAKSRLEQAFENGAESLKGQRLLSQIYIIEKDFKKADSLFAHLKADSKASAALYNDVGVLAYQENDWQRAAEYFELALKKDAQMREAYYNLALANMQQEDFKKAILMLQKYVLLENDKAWINAALNLLNKIQDEETIKKQ